MTMDTSYLAQQVNNSIGQLHGLFDEIGVPDHEREAREEEVGPEKRVAQGDLLTLNANSCSRHCPKRSTTKSDWSRPRRRK